MVIGDDLARFESLSFPDRPGTTWQDHVLTLPPSMVIESIRPGHERHDRQTKHRWYAEFGVPNYWIVDGYRRTLDCLRLERGQYIVDAAGHDQDVVRPSAFAGLTIALRELWTDGG